MKERRLAVAEGFDLSRQKIVGLFVAQFDDQLDLLKKEVQNLSVAQLEWQLHPGLNTIGMLLAHLAIVEVFWIDVAAKEIKLEPDGDEQIKRTIGIYMDDDGLPLKPDGHHPKTLSGKSITDYFQMLDAARSSIKRTLGEWQDSDLENTYLRGERKITRSWTLYHVLAHFAGHFGQILLIKHLMRDEGVLLKEESV